MVNIRLKKSIYTLLILLAGLSNTMNAKDLTEFDWLATESAPKNYPMQIISGSFRYHGSKNDGLYVPSGGVLYRGWGSAISSHVVGPDRKPLPDKLDITYFSYMEDAFYEGSFDLPYEKILSLFREGMAADKQNPTYRYIMVGVAPGGSVAVWVTGRDTVEVFFGQAKKVNLNIEEEFRVPVKNRPKYVADIVEDSVKPEILAAIRKNGIPFQLWSQYRKKYRWIPTFTLPIVGQHGITFLNAEDEYIHFPLMENVANTVRPAPFLIGFSALIPGEKLKDVYSIQFDDVEILDVFARLGSKQELIRLEIDPKLPQSATQIRAYNDKESISLKKFTIDE